MAIPKTTAVDIINRLNGLAESGEKLSPFEDARFKRDLEALKSKELSVGLMAFGVFYALMGNAEKAIEYHVQSIDAGGRLAFYFKNFSISLKHLGLYSRALENYFEAAKRDMADRSTIMKAAELVSCVGKFTEFSVMLNSYLKATQDESIMDEYRISNILEIKDDLARLGLDEASYAHACTKAEQVTQKHGLKTTECIVNTLHSDGHDYICIELRVKCSGEMLSIMNDDLATAIAEDIDFSYWNKIIHVFTYASHSPAEIKLSAA